MKTVYVNLAPRTDDPQNRASQKKTYVDIAGRVREIPQDTIRPSGEAIRLTFQFDPEKGIYRTGLEEEIDNEFYNQDGKFIHPSTWDQAKLRDVALMRKITKQMYYEIKFGLPPGHLTVKASPRRDMYGSDRTRERTEIESFVLLIYAGKANVFNDKSLRGALAIALLENHSLVAKTRDQIIPYKTKCYIAQEQEEVKEANKRKKTENKALAALERVADINDGKDIYKVATVLTKDGVSVIQGNVTAEGCYSALDNFIRSKTDQSENCELFVSIVNQALTRETRDLFEIRYAVQQAINKSLIVLSKNNYVWRSQEHENPNWYRFKNIDEVVQLFCAEYAMYGTRKRSKQSENVEQETVQNAWAILKKELEAKEVKYLI